MRRIRLPGRRLVLILPHRVHVSQGGIYSRAQRSSWVLFSPLCIHFDDHQSRDRSLEFLTTTIVPKIILIIGYIYLAIKVATWNCNSSFSTWMCAVDISNDIRSTRILTCWCSSGVLKITTLVIKVTPERVKKMAPTGQSGENPFLFFN